MMRRAGLEASDALVIAGVAAASALLTNPVLANLVLGAAGSWTAVLMQNGWSHCRARLLSEPGLLNHDLQAAMRRAFGNSITHLEKEWWNTHRGAQIRRATRADDRVAIEGLFEILREDAAKVFEDERLRALTSNEQILQLLRGDDQALTAALEHQLSTYLFGHDPQLINFIRRYLVSDLACFIGEELKTNRPESNRAWRAFQRLLLEGLQASIGEIQVTQHDMAKLLDDLNKWAERMDARLPTEREPTGQIALENTLARLTNALLDAITRESEVTREAITGTIAAQSDLTRDTVVVSVHAA
jgi:hypothetical protein